MPTCTCQQPTLKICDLITSNISFYFFHVIKMSSSTSPSSTTSYDYDMLHDIDETESKEEEQSVESIRRAGQVLKHVSMNKNGIKKLSTY